MDQVSLVVDCFLYDILNWSVADDKHFGHKQTSYSGKQLLPYKGQKIQFIICLSLLKRETVLLEVLSHTCLQRFSTWISSDDFFVLWFLRTWKLFISSAAFWKQIHYHPESKLHQQVSLHILTTIKQQVSEVFKRTVVGKRPFENMSRIRLHNFFPSFLLSWWWSINLLSTGTGVLFAIMGQ